MTIHDIYREVHEREQALALERQPLPPVNPQNAGIRSSAYAAADKLLSSLEDLGEPHDRR